MRLLLSDGSGLTSRQVATQAGAAGHHVEVVSPSRVGATGFTRHVRRVHRVPAYGLDPVGWLEATLCVLREGRHDVLLATQEQVALLARRADRVRALGVGLAVPGFEALLRVQDKVAQARTLDALGLPHPETLIANGEHDLLERAIPPVYLKAPIGTASNAVRRVEDNTGLVAAAREFARDGAFTDGGLVAQRALPGSLVMIQAIFDHGRLVAWHANLREREGASGGASAKRSIHLPEAAEHLELLGTELRWHGALSLDAILTADGPSYIDLNPRLVEPGNAWRAGVDLVDCLLRLSLGEHIDPLAPGRPGVRTHQLLLAVLAGAQRGRAALARELAAALTKRGPYAHSAEELTPLNGDPLSFVPVAAAATATLIHPKAARWFTEGAVVNYALTPAAWRTIRDG